MGARRKLGRPCRENPGARVKPASPAPGQGNGVARAWHQGPGPGRGGPGKASWPAWASPGPGQEALPSEARGIGIHHAGGVV